MRCFNIGDIVFVSNYKYKNGKLGNNNLFVIIDDGQAIEINYFGFLISSNIDKAKYTYNKKIIKNNKNNLKLDSIVKCDDLIEITDNEIKFKIGTVEQKDLENFIKTFSKYLEEN